MKTEWDYTDLAEAYLKRPDYAQSAIDQMLEKAGVKEGSLVCDVGAGAAHLTLKLAAAGLQVSAVEPNDAMRGNGIKRTEQYKNVQWYEGVGEHTGMESDKYDLVTFGSSFNVCNRQEALIEVKRILKDAGWFACMWNHRDLKDPLQKEIEDILKAEIGWNMNTTYTIIKKCIAKGAIQRTEQDEKIRQMLLIKAGCLTMLYTLKEQLFMMC